MRCDGNASTEEEELGPDDLGASAGCVGVLTRSRRRKNFSEAAGNARQAARSGWSVSEREVVCLVILAGHEGGGSCPHAYKWLS